MTRRSVVLTLLIAIFGAIPARLTGQQPRDMPRLLTKGTATVTGTIVGDDAQARPLRRVTITLSPSNDPRANRVIASDDAGRFAFTAVPAGAYRLVATKPGYVTTYYGAKRAGSTVGVPVTVAEGERVEGLTVRMPRGAVITGTVLNENGKPWPAISVRVQRVVVSPDGARSLVAAGNPIQTTDDRGMYRVFGLAAGDYVVSVQPRVGPLLDPLGRAGGAELRQITAAELTWAERQIQTASGAPAPSAQAPPAQGPPVAYANVFHPSTADLSEAALVTLTAGQERAGVDVRALLVSTARISGKVLGPDGSLAVGYAVSLIPGGSGVDDASRLVQIEVGLLAPDPTQRTGMDGTFVMTGVQPGAYTLTVRSAQAATADMSKYTFGAAAARGASAGVGPNPLWAMTDVEINGRDLTDVTLTLSAGMTVSGVVTFAAVAGRAPVDRARLMIGLAPAQSTGVATSQQAFTPEANGAFSLTGVVPGRYRLTTNFGGVSGPTTPWMLKSAMLGGRDVADVPFDVKANESVTGLAVTMTDALSEISGVVYDSAGKPSSELSLIVFAADRAMWFKASRRLRQPVRAASDGKFSFADLPAGDYYLAALTDFEPSGWFSASFLEQIVPSAITIKLGPGEKKVQDVKMAR